MNLCNFLENLSEKMAERFYILVHHNGEITNTIEGMTFCNTNPVCVSVHPSMTLLELQRRILQKLRQQNNK